MSFHIRNVLKSVIIQSTQEQEKPKNLLEHFFYNLITYLSNFDKPKTFLANSLFLMKTEVIRPEVINIVIGGVKLVIKGELSFNKRDCVTILFPG